MLLEEQHHPGPCSVFNLARIRFPQEVCVLADARSLCWSPAFFVLFYSLAFWAFGDNDNDERDCHSCC